VRAKIMKDEREFRIRPGRIRTKGAQRARPFIAQALAAAEKAGGRVSRAGKITPSGRSTFGRGRSAAVQANRFLTSRSRGAVVKARVVRHSGKAPALGTHLAYLRREGVTRDGEKAKLFGPSGGEVDGGEFAERCEIDRHHFRFIVSPDDAVDMSDLRGFTGDLMRQVAKDLGTKLDWAAVDHWNTAHPHIHFIIRGVRDDGEDLVISRDYIKSGMRDRARDLITQELGPRTDLDIRRSLEGQIETERWTSLDRQLVRDANQHGVIDTAPHSGGSPDEFHVQKVARLRKLETLGLANEIGAGQWTISDKAEATLRELGLRGDIIKRMHQGLAERGIERSTGSYDLAGERLGDPVVGRLVARGLADELQGTAFAVIDGVDGRVHHVALPDLDAAGDSEPGSIVELRKFEDARGRHRIALAVRSDFDIERQVTANGATWLDRQAVSRETLAVGDGGFGAEVKGALERRADHLVGLGFAERRGPRVVFPRSLLSGLREREVNAVGTRLAAEAGSVFKATKEGEYASGAYRRRLTLASGRFAMIDDGLGFQLVPWTQSLESRVGQHVSGISRGDGGIDWSFGKKLGVGL
jgi:type IV secretory pathway VirD2 relaxase